MSLADAQQLAWVVNLDLFKGASLAALAKSIGWHHVTMSREAGKPSHNLRMRNRAQTRHGWKWTKKRRKGQRRP